MKLVVTIQEETFDAALGAIRAIQADHDMVELRAESFAAIDPAALRAATSKPLILTHRGRTIDQTTIASAIAAGVDFVDVEYSPSIDGEMLQRYAERIVLSHHDFEGMPEIEPLLADMRRFGCAHTKLAVTPATLAGNLRLLRAIAPGVTVIGMGERGLFSRVLAPFRGSELAFVAVDAARSAAPGQITLEKALAIYGPQRQSLRATHVFAIAGDPAGHSLSPAIHNPFFREKGADAAYTIASFADFREISGALVGGELRGLSVTAPFKEKAFEFLDRRKAWLNPNALESGAVNTLVRTHDGLAGDNTDVDGFAALLERIERRARKPVALIGAGGTARAALVALRREEMNVTIFNRTPEKAQQLAERFGARVERLEELPRFEGGIVINTLPPTASIGLSLRPGTSYIEAAYGSAELARRAEELAGSGVQVFTGLDLIHAQAVRQNQIFVEAIR